MEKVINWKLIRSCNKLNILYELDLNKAIIHKLIQDKYVNTKYKCISYKSLDTECFELNRCISIRSLEDYTRGYNNYDYENKRIQILFPFGHNKYPSHRTVISNIPYSYVVEKLDKDFLDNSITCLEGNLSSDEIETPEDINNITDIILYLWKKK